ncbi:MAG: tripartite tricarboxylate transporter TctB family protein [Thermodesulfobacteriota bacterium]
MKLSFRHIFNLSVVVLLAVYVITAMGYNRQARLMPLVISIPILILAIWQTVLDFTAERKFKEPPSKTSARAPEAPAAAVGEVNKELRVYLWVIFMFVSLYLVGFIATTFLFTFLSLKVRSGFSLKSSLGVSVGSLAFLYVLLIRGLHVDLYPGVITLALRKAFLGY